jgi:hypothetical protein
MIKQKCSEKHPMYDNFFCEKDAGHVGLHMVSCWEVPEGNLKWGIPTREEMGYGKEGSSGSNN